MSKFKTWLADKPKWLQWIIGTNLGRMAVNGFLIILFSQLAEYVARNPYNTIAIVFFFILMAQIAVFTIVAVINSIKHDY